MDYYNIYNCFRYCNATIHGKAKFYVLNNSVYRHTLFIVNVPFYTYTFSNILMYLFLNCTSNKFCCKIIA